MSQPKPVGDVEVTSEPAPASAPVRVVNKTPRAKRKWGISLYHAWCKKCGICGEFCPTDALVNDELGTPMIADEDKCTGCMQCVHRCPDFCVEVFEKVQRPTNGDPVAEQGTHDGEPTH